MGKPIELSNTVSLKEQADKSQRQKRLREAAQKYEQQFLRRMMKSMRKTVPDGGLVKKNQAHKMYQEQLDNKYVKQWSEQGGVGLADLIYKQLESQVLGGKKSLDRPKGPLPIDDKLEMKEIEKEKGLQKLKNNEANKKVKTSETEFLMRRPLSGQDSSPVPVKSPWSGTVSQIFSNRDGLNFLKVKHPEGRESTLSFSGHALNLSSGDQVEAGQKLGTLSPDVSQLSWKVTDFDAISEGTT